MNRFLEFFDHAGKTAAHVATSPATAASLGIAGELVSTVNPALGSLMETVANGVVAVEAQAAAKAVSGATTSGKDKKAQVQAIVGVATPLALQAVSAATGKPETDAAALVPLVDDLIDLTVKFFHDFRLFTHAVKPVPAAPTPAAKS
jgi:hypothetical protein